MGTFVNHRRLLEEPPLLPVPDATISQHYSCAAEVQLVSIGLLCSYSCLSTATHTIEVMEHGLEFLGVTRPGLVVTRPEPQPNLTGLLSISPARDCQIFFKNVSPSPV